MRNGIMTLLFGLAISACSSTYNPDQAVADARFALSAVSSEVAFELRRDGKEALAVQIEKDSAEVSELIQVLLDEETPDLDKLRTGLQAVEKRVMEELQKQPPEVRDLWIHRVTQIRTTVAYLIDRFERAKAAEVAGG